MLCVGYYPASEGILKEMCFYAAQFTFHEPTCFLRRGTGYNQHTNLGAINNSDLDFILVHLGNDARQCEG
jgi:hypothetical protein